MKMTYKTVFEFLSEYEETRVRVRQKRRFFEIKQRMCHGINFYLDFNKNEKNILS